MQALKFEDGIISLMSFTSIAIMIIQQAALAAQIPTTSYIYFILIMRIFLLFIYFNLDAMKLKLRIHNYPGQTQMQLIKWASRQLG